MDRFDFDLFTIGGGSGGVRASRFAASLGAKVAIAEAQAFGGTCVNVGCVPKKLMSMAAHFHEDHEDAVGFGWQPVAPAFDWPTLIARKDAEIARLNGLYELGLKRAGVTVLRGWARLVDAHTVEVGGQRHTARHILLATGGEPTRAALPGRSRQSAMRHRLRIFAMSDRAGRLPCVCVPCAKLMLPECETRRANPPRSPFVKGGSKGCEYSQCQYLTPMHAENRR